MHLSCLDEDYLIGESGEYECEACADLIVDKDRMVYGVIGAMPEERYTYAERRGYELFLVYHYDCWYDQDMSARIRELRR
jgi:hypothetical protein